MIQKSVRSAFLILVALFVLSAQTSFAGVFADIGTYMKNRSDINTHTKGIGNAIKELYRDRAAISTFARSAANLISAYRDIKDKKANISSLMNIAQSITSLVGTYNTVGPKFEATYSKIKPDLQYFSSLQGAVDTQAVAINGKSLAVKTLTDGRIGALSGAVGWVKVFDTIKDNPLNIFRIGRLTDEYKMGKAEGQYALKCTQIAFEAESYYTAGKSYLAGILDIKKQIDAITSGNIGAILNINSTINNLTSAGPGLEDFGALANTASNQFGKRFEELKVIQDSYVKQYQNYKQKYVNGATTGSSSSGVTSSGNQASGSSSGYQPNGTQPVSQGMSLQKAYEAYQSAYMNYVSITQNANATTAQRNAAIQKLNSAKSQYEASKTAGAR